MGGVEHQGEEQWIKLRANVIRPVKEEWFDMEAIVTCDRLELFKGRKAVNVKIAALVDTKSTTTQLKAVKLFETPYKRPLNSMDIHGIILGGRRQSDRVNTLVTAGSPAEEAWFRDRMDRAGLNRSQVGALKLLLNSPGGNVNVRGPPGCGKTVTAVIGLELIVRCGVKVLACAASNNAVENLLERVIADGHLAKKKFMRWTPRHITEGQYNAAMNTGDDTMMEEAERLVAFNLSEFEVSNADWVKFEAYSPAAHIKSTLEMFLESAEPIGAICRDFKAAHEKLRAASGVEPSAPNAGSCRRHSSHCNHRFSPSLSAGWTAFSRHSTLLVTTNWSKTSRRKCCLLTERLRLWKQMSSFLSPTTARLFAPLFSSAMMHSSTRSSSLAAKTSTLLSWNLFSSSDSVLWVGNVGSTSITVCRLAYASLCRKLSTKAASKQTRDWRCKHPCRGP